MRSGLARFVHDKVRLATALVLIPLALSLFAGTHWLIELTSHFQAHYFVALVLSVVVLMFFRDRKWSAIAGAGAIAAGVAVVPWYFGGPGSGEISGVTPVRLLLANVYTANTQSARVIELARAEKVDFAVLQEIDERWVGELEPMGEFLPHRRSIPRDDNFGIGEWSRGALSEVQEIESELSGVPTITAQIEVGGRKILVIATHPVPPASAEGAESRNAQLEALGGMAARATMPVVLIGDLNVTMWSPHYRRLEKTSGLKNTRQGFGVLPTWPAQFYGLGIPLDHCLVSPELGVVGVRRGKPIGSDHFPLIVDLVVPGGK